MHMWCPFALAVAAPVMAQDDEAGRHAVDPGTVLVTARRVAEVERRVPISLIRLDAVDLERRGIVIATVRETCLLAEGVGPLNQLFFAAASTSVTVTAPPCRRWRTTAPVVHQVRLFCQLRPASCRVRQIV